MDKKVVTYIAVGILVIALIMAPIALAKKPGGGGGRAKPQCNDDIDNDGDTFIDFPDDPGCTKKNDQSELGTTQCDNGIDDDSDNYIDYPDDTDCDSPSDDNETEEDLTPPGPITGLGETSKGTTWIYWEWTNPSDPDFDHTEVWLDTSFKVNTTNEYYNATSLNPETSYELEVRPVDTLDNIGEWINDSATTEEEPDTENPLVSPVWPTSVQANTLTTFYASVTDNVQVSECEFQWNGGSYVDMWLNSGTYQNGNWTANYTTPGAGDYYANVSCNDTSNNRGYGAITNITVYPEDYCDETDFGFNPPVEGTVSGYEGGQPFNHTDYCIDSDLLTEYYCWYGYHEYENFSCVTNGTTCSNGACV